MEQKDEAYGADAAQLSQTVRAAYQNEVSAIARRMLGDVDAVVEEVASDRTKGPALLINLPFDGFHLRLSVSGAEASHPPRAEFGDMLQRRISEASSASDRFVQRLEDVRVKVEASLLRNGEMKLVLLEMTRQSIREPFDCCDGRIDAVIEYVGVRLKPELEIVSDHTARAMAGTIRLIGKNHQRRIKIRDRLESIGAAYEIDSDAELFIIECGYTVGRVANLLAEQRSIELVSPSGNAVTVGVMDGRIFLVSSFDRRGVRRPVSNEEVRTSSTGPAA